MSIEEKQMIFKLRSEVTDVKMNFKGMHEDLKCKICNEENETQKHILECKILNKDETQIRVFSISDNRKCAPISEQMLDVVRLCSDFDVQ